MPSYRMPLVTVNSRTEEVLSAYGDSISDHGIVQIETPHHEVHKGKFYRAAYDWDEIVQDEVRQVLIYVSPDHAIHIRFAVVAYDDIRFTLYEDPTPIDAEGLQFDTINKNREVGGFAAAAFYADPAVGGTGAQLCQQRSFAGSNMLEVCHLRENTEWILQRDHYYLVEILAVGSGSYDDLQFIAEFYEEPYL